MTPEQIASVLSRMTVAGLQSLDAALKDELGRRLDTAVVEGRTGHFIHTGDQTKRLVIVVRNNVKTVTVKELGDSVKPGMQWKVSKSMLKIDPIERRGIAARSAPTTAKPATASSSAWG